MYTYRYGPAINEKSKVMVYIAMAYMVMAYIALAWISLVMAHTVMAYIALAYRCAQTCTRTHKQRHIDARVFACARTHMHAYTYRRGTMPPEVKMSVAAAL